jgi:hypothetical protein
MRGFEGQGGKKPKKNKKPQTSKGQAFSDEIEQSCRQVANSMPPNKHPPHPPCNQEDYDHRDDNETQSKFPDHKPLGSPPRDPQVEHFHQYLRSQNYVQWQIANEENWEDAYDEMFACFYQCSMKTLTWGKPKKWDQDWKLACNCVKTRQWPVVLVDILS